MAKSPSRLDNIKCPNCGHEIPLSEALSHDIAERTRAEMKAEVAAMATEVKRREDALADSERKVKQTIADQVAAQREAIRDEMATNSRVAISEARAEADRAKAALQKAQASELELRNKASQLEERAASIDLEVARKIDEGKRALLDQAAERLEQENRLKNAAKDKQLSDAQAVIETLQRKLEQGSQQLQGEVLELEIEKLLGSTFPLDEIAPVPKGVNGADVLHNVMRRSGGVAGTIIWELKRTKNFNGDWPSKLKADQRVAKADIAILVTQTMPAEIKHFGQLDGVWVCAIEHVTALALALRLQIIEVDLTRAMQVGKKDKAELLYEYLSGAAFRQRVEAIVEAFTEMQGDIAEERRVAERRWAKREKQVAQVINSTAGMYGDLQGMIGSTMTTIPQLEAK